MTALIFDLKNSGLPDVNFVAELAHGMNNKSYLFESHNGDKFVFRQKSHFEGYGRLDREARVMQFLNYMGIDFIPRTVFLDMEQNLHVMTHVDGEDISPKDFNVEKAELFARQLARLHSIPHGAYKDWCRDKGYDEPEIGTLEGFKNWLKKAGDLVEEKCPDRELAQWVKSNIAQCQTLTKEISPTLKVFAHGDLGGNMKYDNGNLYFIDWECAGLRETPDLGYIFIHGETPDHLQKVIMETYAQERGFNTEESAALKSWTELEMRMQRVDKVLYRAWRYSDCDDPASEEAIEFRNLAYQVLEKEFGGLKLSQPSESSNPSPAPSIAPA